jgi:hypothetical protein
MKKTFGVCAGILAMGIAILIAPATRAQARSAADEAGGGSESTPTTATAPASLPATSSSADLRQRIEALKAELAELNSQLAADKEQDAAAAPQTQASAAPASPAQGGTAPATPPAPTPLPNPSMSGPLATAVPHELGEGPFGKLEVTGILSGMGWTEGNYAPFLNDPSPTHYDISNAQIFIQKTTGWLQFYLQGGAYNIPALGTAFVKTKDTIQGLYGPFPQGYVKLVKGNLNVEVGALPTLIGAEYTFDFENMNIERGLLWNQENAVNRGIQVNDTYKKLSLSFSWNDGFYSSHYNWLTGSAAWAFNASNTLTFVGGGNFNGNGRGLVSASSPATPGLQNNSMIYNLIYTYAHGNWIVTPYYQYTDVKTNATIGIPQGAHTNGGALLVNYNFKHGFSLAARPEYIKSSGSNTSTAANLLGYGPGTGGFSFTATPMWAKDGFFLRADVSVVHITNFNTATGTGFGPTGIQLNQPRGVLEAGFMF